MKVTIGVISYNRLFYLRSFVKSLMYSLDGMDVELICIDDDSQESGTKEYLEYLDSIGWIVINQNEERTSAKKSGLNDVAHVSPMTESFHMMYTQSSGDIILPLQGDCQFIRKGWLKDVINLYENVDGVKTVLFDAQRKERLNKYEFEHVVINGISYHLDKSQHYVSGGGDQALSRGFLDAMGGWSSTSSNAENTFVRKAINMYGDQIQRYSLSLPACICIYTDSSGTNARIRDGKVFGDYWAAQDDLYYEYIDTANYTEIKDRPYSIEEVAKASWEFPIDKNGNWKKNPIDVKTCTNYRLIS